MDREQILRKLTSIFQDVFDDDELVVKPEYSAEDVDGWDSLTHIRMILTVEKAFSIKLSTSEVGRLKRVEDLITLIQSKIPS